jgi:TRAP-type C4-dicarboxylate transport system permease small subunit
VAQRAIDRSAEGAPLGFRLLIFPGAAALWPLSAHEVDQVMTRRTAHRARERWPILAVVVALLFVAALIAREWRGG